MFSQKDTHQFRQLFFLSLCFLLLVGFVTAANYDSPVTDPSPIFRLTFLSPADYPIQILSANLSSVPPALLLPLNVHIMDSLSSRFNFTFDGYLLNGNYTFGVLSKDKDNNVDYYEDTFTIKAPMMNMWISDPHTDYYPPHTQDVSVGSQIPYTMTLHTEFPSICRVVFNNPPFFDEMYEDPVAEFNNGLQTFTTTHTLFIVNSLNTSIPAAYQLQVQEFSQTNYELYNSYVIMCKRESIGNQGNIIYPKKFYIGYDRTAPNIQAWFEPEVQEDLSQINNNKLHLQSDDLVACSYDYTINPTPQQQETPGTIPSSFEGIQDYSLSHVRIFDYFGQSNDFEEGQYYAYELNLTCQNLAGQESWTSVPFAVNISRQFSIFLENQYYTVDNPTLVFNTTKQAKCYYNNELLGADELKDTHLLPLSNLDEGAHNISLFCTNNYDSLWENFTFFVDTILPEDPVFLGGNYSCGMHMELSLDTPNKPLLYTIKLYNSTIPNEDYLIYGSYQTADFVDNEYHLDLTDYVNPIFGGYYIWEVYGTDLVGRNTSIVTQTLIVNDENDAVCDTIDPTALVDIQTRETGILINLSCYDNQSGCADTYLYSYLEKGEPCTYPPTSLADYSTPLEVNEDGEFCYEVTDLAGNVFYGHKSVTVDLNISVESPSFGVANSKIFNFTVLTDRNVHCAQGYRAAVVPTNMEDWYNSLTPFTTTGGVLHTSILSANDITPDSSQDEVSENWVVICKEQEMYHVYETKLGYDVTPPTISVVAQANPIVDPAAMYTQLTAESDDDVVCTYLDNGVPAGFPGYNVDDKSAYTPSHSVLVDYWNKPNNEYYQEISCRNLAGSFSKTNMTVGVDLRDEVNIIFNNEKYSNTKTFLFNVSTLQQADCVYRINDSEEDQNFTTTGKYEHLKQLSLNEGKYSLAVFCNARGSQDKGYAVTTITVDTKAPSLELILPTQSCSLKDLRVSFLASGTGSPIDKFNYTLRNSSGIVAFGEQEDPNLDIKVDLINGSSYTLRVFAFDKAGNLIFKDGSILAISYDDLVCDTKNPTGNVAVGLSWEGNKLTISCSDNESGCTDSFSYAYDSNGFCTQGYMVQDYATQNITSKETTTFCYKVFDKANNQDNGSVNITYIAQCYNGIEDPDEEGVDCGGPCLANCGTCFNGKIDPFEEGVDCGGVCETYLICGYDASQSTCATDNDCLLDEHCVFGSCVTKPNTSTTTTPPDTPEPTQEGCVSDDDCIESQYCSFGNCIDRSTDQQRNPEFVKKKASLLGIVLFILGILLILGGIVYIYYSRRKKAEEQAKNRAAYQQQQASLAQQQQTAQQTEKQKKYREILKKKQEEGNQARSQHLQERKEKRKTLLETFKVEGVEEKIKKNSAKDLIIKTHKTDSLNKNLKLDEGHTEEYVDVRELGKKAKVDQTIKTKNLSKQDLTNLKTKEKQDPFSKLVHLVKNKQNLTEKSPTEKKKSFAALERMIAGTKAVEVKEKLSSQKKVSSSELIDLFTTGSMATKTLDSETLISVLGLLLEQKKLDKPTITNLLEKLVAKKAISQEQSEIISSKIVRGS